MKPHNQRRRQIGRQTGGTFFALPAMVLESAEWAALDAYSVKLLVDLGSQFNGKNNGDLCAAMTTMKPKGWRSSATLNKTLRRLRETGFIELTRQGGKHAPSLFALTWRGIDECGGKLDMPANPIPTHAWKNNFRGRVVEQSGRVVEQFKQKVVA